MMAPFQNEGKEKRTREHIQFLTIPILNIGFCVPPIKSLDQRMQKSQHTDEFALFCELLRERRRKAKLTQVELADKLEVTQSMLSKMERGELRLDVVQVRAFCLAMECSFVGLIKEFDDKARELS